MVVEKSVESSEITRAAPVVSTGFARADDGLVLHWRTVGQGPVIACLNGVGVSTFFWKYLAEHFSDRFTVLLWDYRGHGRSGRQLDPRHVDLSVERHADDLAAVLDDISPPGEPALLVGHSMGCQVALEVRRRHPARVAGLVLALGTAGRAMHTFFDYPGSVAIFKQVHRLIFALGGAANPLMRPLLESPIAWIFAKKLSLVDPYYTRRDDMVPYMHHLATLDQRIFIESVRQADEHDAWGVLPDLDRPMLVIAAENDKFTPMWCSRKMAAITPGAEILVLADASHAALIEQPETINHRIERFIEDRLSEWAK